MATGSAASMLPNTGTDANIALAVDLDETLIAADTLIEGAAVLVKRHPSYIVRLLRWLAAGKHRFKARIAGAVTLDVARLPYRAEVLEYLRAARSQGRRIVLATAANGRVANQVAAHLGLFDEVIASDDAVNLAGERKRQRLVALYGERGFDYVGSGRADVPVWRSARLAVLVGHDAALSRRASAVTVSGAVIAKRETGLADYLSALRLHHWLKNLLIFAPLIVAHRLADQALLTQAGVAFLAFGLCASGVYLLNDLLDIEDDRRHPRKRARPIPSGRVPARVALAGSVVLLAIGLGLGLRLSGEFALVLAGYVFLNLLYSLWLKAIVIVDVLVLAGFHAMRITAGSVVTGLWLSPWLMTVAVLMFLSLALVKRYAELVTMREVDGVHARARGYRSDDARLLAAFGAGAGCLAAAVLALCIHSGANYLLFARPSAMWVLCVLMLCWISYLWLMARHRRMHDDPLVFALLDPVSCVLIALMVGVYLSDLRVT